MLVRIAYSLDFCFFSLVAGFIRLIPVFFFCSDRGAGFFSFSFLLRLAVLIALFCRGRRLRPCEVGAGELKFPQSRVLARALYGFSVRDELKLYGARDRGVGDRVMTCDSSRMDPEGRIFGAVFH